MLITINNFQINGISCNIVLNSDNNQLYIDIKHNDNDNEIMKNLLDIKNINSFMINNQLVSKLQNSIVHYVSFIPNQIILIVQPQEEKNNEKS